MSQKRLINNDQAMELYNFFEDIAEERFKSYDKSHNEYKQDYKSVEDSIDPNSDYGKRYFASNAAKIGHESDEIYHFYKDRQDVKEMGRSLEQNQASPMNVTENEGSQVLGMMGGNVAPENDMMSNNVDAGDILYKALTGKNKYF